MRLVGLVWMVLIAFASWTQSDSLQRCNEYLDQAQRLLGENKLQDAERIAFLGWELSQKIANEELMARACFCLSEGSRELGKEAEAYEFAVRGKYLGQRSSETYFVACHLSLLRALFDQQLWSMIEASCHDFEIPNFMSFEEKAELYYFLCSALNQTSQGLKALKIIQDFRSASETDFLKHSPWNERFLSLAVESAILSKSWNEADVNCNALVKAYYGSVDKLKRIKWNGWMSQIQIQKKDFKAALEYYNKSILLCSDADNQIKLPLLINVAECHYLADNLVVAQQYLEQALELSEQLANYYYQALCNVFLSALNNKKGWLNYSIDYAQQALSLAEKADDLEIHLEMHNLLAKYQTMNNKQDLAYYHQQESQKVLKEIMKRRQEESLKQSVRFNKLQGKEYLIRSDVDAQRERKRMTELKINQTENEKLLAEIRSRKEVDSYKNELQKNQRIMELERNSAELEKQRQLNIIQNLEIEQGRQENSSLILAAEAANQKAALFSSEKERAELALKDQEKSLKIEEQNKQRNLIVMASLILFLSLVVVTYFLFSLRKKNFIIRSQNDQINLVNATLNEKNHEIVSGIEYASKFQSIVFPTESDLKKYIEGAFILHKPLELVSGDLPFVLKDGHFLFVAAVDCIGHGVSASMLSIMTYFNLSEIIRSKNFQNCSEVLMELHRRLEIRSNEAKIVESNLLVSIDLALIKINLNNNEVQFSGANLPLMIQSKNQVQMIKGNPFSIGEYWGQKKFEFTDYHQLLQRGDRLFIFSDGFFHQFGGAEMKQKLSKKRTSDWIHELSHLPIADMKCAMDERFENWKGSAHQTDDVVFIGLEI